MNEKVVKELWIDRNSGGTPKFLVVTRLKSEAEIKKSKNVNKVGYQIQICGHFFSNLENLLSLQSYEKKLKNSF